MEPGGSLRCSQQSAPVPCPESDESNSQPPIDFPSGLFLSDFPIRLLYAFLIVPMRVTSPAHLILLDLIALVLFGE